jgi:hypothetical protein
MAIVELENVPVTLAAFRAVKVWPTAGVKALTSAAVSVPPKKQAGLERMRNLRRPKGPEERMAHSSTSRLRERTLGAWDTPVK